MDEIVRCDRCDNGIQADWGYCAYCGDVLLTADEKADAYCQTPAVLPLPANPPQPPAIDGLAEDMAKALAQLLSIFASEDDRIKPHSYWGCTRDQAKAIILQARAALSAYRARARSRERSEQEKAL